MRPNGRTRSKALAAATDLAYEPPVIYAWRILLLVFFCLAAAAPMRAAPASAGGCPSQKIIQRACLPQDSQRAMPAPTAPDVSCSKAVLGELPSMTARPGDAVPHLLADEPAQLGSIADRDDPPPKPVIS